MKRDITDSLFSRADEIVTKAKRDGNKLAVFKTQDGRARTCKINGSLYAKALEKGLFLIGVYDYRCDPVWLAEDLAYCGVRA